MLEIGRAEKLLTELEIKNLLVRERYYRDSQQWEKLRSCYHSDTSKTNIKITWSDIAFINSGHCITDLPCRYHGDVDGFVAGSQKMARRSASSSHTVCPVEVHLNGDRAVSESTGTILARFVHEGTALDCASYGRFISCLERVGTEWKICTLEVIYDKDSLLPVTPDDATKTISLSPGARLSYRCLAWVLEQNGFAIDQDLPGTDRPGSGEAVLQSCFQWLRNES